MRTANVAGVVLAVVVFVVGVGQVAADVIDLTTVGAEGWVGGACFRQFNPDGSMGTGRINPFLQVQGPASGGVETGYNTLGTLEYDTKSATALQVCELSLVTLDEIDYYGFLLDVNEAGGNKSLISLDVVSIYVEDSPDLDDSQFGTPVYNLDAVGDNTVLMDASLVGPGSGDGDMVMLVPSALFGSNPDRYIYLNCSFGATAQSESGFEEWTVLSGGGDSAIPEPATLLLLGTGAMLLVRRRS